MVTSRYFILMILVVVVAVFGYRFNAYVLEKDYTILANTICDPLTESCFVADCDPDEDSDCDISPYKKVEILAHEAPACLLEHTCEQFACSTESCVVTECSEEDLEEGEVCALVTDTLLEEGTNVMESDDEQDEQQPE